MVDRVLLGLVATVALSTVWILFGPAPAAVSWLSQTALNGVFVGLSWRVAQGPTLSSEARRFWRVVTVGGAFFVVGTLLQGAQALSGPHDTAVGDTGPMVLMTIGVAWVVGSMLIYPPDATGRERWRLWLDAATVMAAAAVFIWSMLISGRASSSTPGELALTLIGTCLTLVSVFAIVRMLLSPSAPFTVGTGLAGALAVALFGVGEVLNPLIAQSDDIRPTLAARLVPALLLAAAPRIEQLRTRTFLGVLRRRRAPYTRLPFVATLATQILLIAQLTLQGLDARSWGTIAGIIVITGLVIIRQNVALADNARLVTRLDDSVEQVSRQERRFRSLLQHASDITMLINGEGAVVYVSPAIDRVLGHPPAATVGRFAVDVLQPNDRPNLERLLAQLINDRSAIIKTHLQVRHGDGSVRWLGLVATSRLDDPSVVGVIINIRDITEAIQLQDRLRYEASHDHLTGLANRALLDQRAEGFVEDTGQQSRSNAVLMLDLDNFKAVNDMLGHHIGDRLLVVVAGRLRNCVRPGDTVARLGGDEFSVFLTGVTRDDAVATAHRILTALSEPIRVENHTLAAPASIGIAVSRSKPLEALLRDSDAAMYEAKRNRSGTHLYRNEYADPQAATADSKPDHWTS